MGRRGKRASQKATYTSIVCEGTVTAGGTAIAETIIRTGHKDAVIVATIHKGYSIRFGAESLLSQSYGKLADNLFSKIDAWAQKSLHQVAYSRYPTPHRVFRAVEQMSSAVWDHLAADRVKNLTLILLPELRNIVIDFISEPLEKTISVGLAKEIDSGCVSYQCTASTVVCD